MTRGFRDQLNELQDVLATFVNQSEQVDAVVASVVEALRGGHVVYTCGNGGSATDAAHLSEELLGRYRSGSVRPPLPSVCLNGESAALTCIGNDFGFEQVFARQIEALGRAGDLLICFSTSGGSPNVLAALRAARERQMRSIALLGGSGGAARTLADHALVVPSAQSARVQETHTLLLHTICEAIEEAFASL